ncbi:hypothetical protein, partial [Phocaeicola plebeius]|uniref:hypothetical protein n=1 Tax=Phocaeicola plebeius TaxID=310297 RepID=UPI0019575337
TYRFNKIIAAETIRFIVTVAIVVYKGLKLVVYRMLTKKAREIRFKPASRAFYAITLIIFCEIMLLAFWL